MAARKRTSFDDVFLLHETLAPVKERTLLKMVRKIEAPPPRGYGEFALDLGCHGVFCDELVVREPDLVPQARNDRAWWKSDFASGIYGAAEWFTADEASRSHPIARTADGASIIYCPSRKEQLFVLPKHHRDVFWLPDGLFDPFRWRDKDGQDVEREAFPFRWFDPQTYERTHIHHGLRCDVKWEPDELVAQLMAFGGDEARVRRRVEARQAFVLTRRASANLCFELGEDPAFGGSLRGAYDRRSRDAVPLLQLLGKLGFQGAGIRRSPAESIDERRVQARSWIDRTATPSSGWWQRFEHRDGKFWHIRVSVNAFTTHWGKLGANGQRNFKEFETSDKALAAAEKLITAKLGQGYAIAKAKKKKPAKKKAAKKKPAKKRKR